MNIYKYLKEKAKTDEYKDTDIYEVILSAKHNILFNTVTIKLWKDSIETMNFCYKMINKLNPKLKIKYKYDMLKHKTFKEYDGKLCTKKDDYCGKRDVTDYDHLVCGKCGKILTSVHDTPSFNLDEHYNFYCGCGCEYHFAFYHMLDGRKIVKGYCTKEVIKVEEYIRNSNAYIMSHRRITDKPTIKYADAMCNIKKYSILELEKIRGEHTKLWAEDQKMFDMLIDSGKKVEEDKDKI